MAFDGFCIKRIVKEYNELFLNGKISKIIQPNGFDIIFVIKREKDTFNLFASANPSMSYTYLINDKAEAPKTALNFCMVLRKYIANGKIISVSQKGNERIISFEIEHLDEMGDRSIKKLIFELMGKHSNIILTDENDIIIDSIKRISALTSSVREVLPKRQYYFPSELSKINPYDSEINSDILKILDSLSGDEKKNMRLSAFLYSNFEGVSKAFAKEIIRRSGFKNDICVSEIGENASLNDNISQISDAFTLLIKEVVDNKSFFVYGEMGRYTDYSTVCLSLDDPGKEQEGYLCGFLNEFYKSKHDESVILQKSSDICNILNSSISKNKSRIGEWEKELKECDNKETLKKYGELLKAYSHSLSQGRSVEVLDYYTGKNIIIPLDENKSIIENSNRYFNDYSKSKRRESKLSVLMEESKKETDYLEEMLLYISLSENNNDLDEIRNELFEKGYLKKNSSVRNRKKTSSIKHYLYDGNYHIYIGKNNIQNEEVTFKIATGNDWWFHAKGVPGSHVIVKSDKDKGAAEWDMPNEVFELCGALAIINSSNSGLSKAEVDYTRKKHIKKPAEGDKGMVIYHTYYSMVAKPDISMFELTIINS
ncbi:MAG: NFACT family protein [Lachnospiraceae bacterium]|nr:NFACT family protein [Lachnospiraceae bacterium]